MALKVENVELPKKYHDAVEHWHRHDAVSFHPMHYRTPQFMHVRHSWRDRHDATHRDREDILLSVQQARQITCGDDPENL